MFYQFYLKNETESEEDQKKAMRKIVLRDFAKTFVTDPISMHGFWNSKMGATKIPRGGNTEQYTTYIAI